jgi:predicted S18 family serine protease
MRTPEDEAFDELAKKQGDWGGGFQAKRQMAADKLQEHEREALKLALEAIEHLSNMETDVASQRKYYQATEIIETALAQPAQETEMLTIAYYSGYHDGKKAALAGREWNFCERCGKRTKDLTTIHTCTPPQEKNA